MVLPTSKLNAVVPWEVGPLGAVPRLRGWVEWVPWTTIGVCVCVCVCVCECVRACVFIHGCMNAELYMPCTHVEAYSSLPLSLSLSLSLTHTHTHTHTKLTRAGTHTHTPAHTHSGTHTHTPAHTHSGTHTHTHTHTLTPPAHAPAVSSKQPPTSREQQTDTYVFVGFFDKHFNFFTQKKTGCCHWHFKSHGCNRNWPGFSDANSLHYEAYEYTGLLFSCLSDVQFHFF